MISVIIPSYNSWPLIERTLISLEKQKYSGEYEVIVADSSDDGSHLEIAKNFPKINLLHKERRDFPGAGRNRAIDASKGDIIAMIDADAEASENWLDVIAKNIEREPDVAGFGGAVENARKESTAAQVAHLLEFGGYTPNWKKRKVRMNPACNLALRREVFDKVRFIEEWFGNEDVLLAKEIESMGKYIIFDPQMLVFHHTRDNWDAIYNHQYNLGRDTGRCRYRYDVPGSWLAHSAGASYLIPLIKYILLIRRVLGPDNEYSGVFFSATSKIMHALNLFAKGFRDGVRIEKSATKFS